MGNCAAASHHHHHAGETWADGDEWDEEEEDHRERREHAAAAEASEVTIRITKRQLHELMERRGGGGRVAGRKSRREAQELLADIMNSGEVRHHEQHREAHWKPALQSIPEAAVES